MHSRHEESSVVLGASAAEAFEFLDDHERLSSHMSKRSLMMGGGKMTTTMDAARGRTVGSVIEVKGRVFGLLLSLKELVVERQIPTRKVWQTIGEPRLLAIGPYQMGYRLSDDWHARLTVWIDYELPSHGLARFLGRLFGRAYARWCVHRMTRDAERAFPTLRQSEEILHASVKSPTSAVAGRG